MNPHQGEIVARILKTSKMRIKKLIEKEKGLLSDLGGKCVENSYRVSIQRTLKEKERQND